MNGLTIDFGVDTGRIDECTRNAIDLSSLSGWLLALVALVSPVSQLLADSTRIWLTGKTSVFTPVTTPFIAGSTRLGRTF